MVDGVFIAAYAALLSAVALGIGTWAAVRRARARSRMEGLMGPAERSAPATLRTPEGQMLLDQVRLLIVQLEPAAEGGTFALTIPMEGGQAESMIEALEQAAREWVHALAHQPDATRDELAAIGVSAPKAQLSLARIEGRTKAGYQAALADLRTVEQRLTDGTAVGPYR